MCVLLCYLFSVYCIYVSVRTFTRGYIICCHCLFVCPSIDSHVLQFKKRKKNFKSKTGENCNKLFSQEELEISLSNAHDTARGPINILLTLTTLASFLAESTLQLTKNIWYLVIYNQFGGYN